MKQRKNIPYRVAHPNIGIGFLVVGVVLAAVAIANMSLFEQLISSMCFALAPFFLVSGALAYTGAWVALRNDRLEIDKGVVLIAAALILGGIVISCLTYRELLATVPYLDDWIPGGTGGSLHGRTPVTYSRFEGVLFYPYVWLSSAVANVVICLGVVGLFYKIARRF